MKMNEVRIAGNLVKDPVVHYTGKGVAVAKARVCVDESYEVDGQKRKVTTFVDVEAWGASGEHLAEAAKKGQKIVVEGALRESRWEDNGQKHSKLFIKAKEWELSRRQRSQAQEQGMER
jgi:single-strand DNA-binding protein